MIIFVSAQSSKVPFNQDRDVPFIEATIEPWKGAESRLTNDEQKRIDPIRSDAATEGKTAEPGRSQRVAGDKRAAGETVVCGLPEARRERSGEPKARQARQSPYGPSVETASAGSDLYALNRFWTDIDA